MSLTHSVRFNTVLELVAAFQGACHQSRDHADAVQAFLRRCGASLLRQTRAAVHGQLDDPTR